MKEGNKGLQEVLRDYSDVPLCGLQGVTRAYKELQRVTKGYGGLQGVLGFTKGYGGLQGNKGAYKGLQGVTRVTGSYKGL